MTRGTRHDRGHGRGGRGTRRALLAALAAAAALGAGPARAGAQEIRAIRVPPGTGLVDLAAAFWNDAPAVAVTMLPQSIVTPMVMEAAVPLLQVKAAHNGQWLAFLLQWADATENTTIVLDRFGDQVAVQLPVRFDPEALPSPMMGNPGGRVAILQWRAAFQHDLDHGAPALRDLYPNALVDVYPDQVLRATDARPYAGAVGLDNAVSRPRRSPVLDQMAEGWGTMTVQAEQHAEGRGVWQDGSWRVIIAHPLDSGSENDPRLVPGGQTVCAFAVWDGAAGEVGARKAWAAWVPLALAP